MTKYVLGLDINIASIGWSVLNKDQERIESCGVHIFPKAEVAKTGAALASLRREARSMRRKLRRRTHRLERVRRLFVHQQIAGKEDIQNIISHSSKLDPYQLRAEGLDRLLNNVEWIKILYHIATRRGVKSDEKNKQTDKGLLTVEQGESLFSLQGNYRTIGEMLYKDEKFRKNKRNKVGDFTQIIKRDSLIKEVKLLFKQQRIYNNPFSKEDFEEKYIEIFTSQKEYAEGDQINKMIGYCTFENEENGKEGQKRAPKASYSAEKFLLLLKLINCKVVKEGQVCSLSLNEINMLKNFAHIQSEITYKEARKLLKLNETDYFKGLNYKYNNGNKPEDSILVKLEYYHKLRKIIEKKIDTETWLELSTNTKKIDDIAEVLTYYKFDKAITEKLAEKNIEKKVFDAVLDMSFRGVVHLSLKALNKILPLLEQGKRYDQACKIAGYNQYKLKNGEKRKLLPLLPEGISNPVVKRALNKTRKIINEIVRKYGSPYQINIEIARDLSKPYNERQRIINKQEAFRAQKEYATNRFMEKTKRIPSSVELLKFRLWEEQKGCCPCSLENIDIQELTKDEEHTQIDYIIPYSRSFDDSLSNKMLVKTKANKNKKNRTPYEILNFEQWQKFEAWVNKTMRGRKQQLLLRKDFSLYQEEIKERNINDKRYISRFMARFLEENLLFHSESNEKPVRCINGQLTTFLRSKWGLGKYNKQSDLHHALDAAVVSSVSAKLIGEITEYSQNKKADNIELPKDIFANSSTGEIIPTTNRNYANDYRRFPQPWPYFRKELIAKLVPDVKENLIHFNLTDYNVNPIFVSRTPNRKIAGAAHKDTIRSKKYLAEGTTCVRTPLAKIKLKDLENMVGKERDYVLYQALKNRLEQYGDVPEKAFQEPFYKPTRNGLQGPIVRSVKIFSVKTSGVEVRQGIADNDRMVRIDVYCKNKRYYLVPVYLADIVRKKIKNRAIVGRKTEDEWTQIDKSYDFLFSLFYNDLVEVNTGKETLFGYYVSCHRGTGCINIVSHDNNKNFGKDGIKEGVSVKTALSFRKFNVDILGQNIREINREKPPYEMV